jgi:succinoglycan biosynthesis protein ExoM
VPDGDNRVYASQREGGATQPARTRVDVCVCTFRRPYLAKTLRSIAANAGPRVDLRVVVADNDTIPSARQLTEAFADETGIPVRYVHAPATNISLARNSCLDAASADFVAFVDDDEHVSPHWLDALLRTAIVTSADVVLGPVTAVYGADAPKWMCAGDFHSTSPAYVNGVIQTGYTCNVLMRRREPFSSLRFDLSLGRSGGEDTEYFYRLHDLGGRIAFAPDAIVYEPVPAERARLGWLMRRRLRSGQTYGMWLVRSSRSGWVALALASAKSGYCLVMATLNILFPVRSRRYLLRGTLHLGVVRGLLRARQASLYGGVGNQLLNGERASSGSEDAAGRESADAARVNART